MIINYDVLITSAMGFSLAMIWNETFIKIINSCFPKNTERQIAAEYIIYAFVITIVIILVSILINKLAIVGGNITSYKPIITNIRLHDRST